MSKIYCDNCEKDDQSITVNAILAQDLSGQASDTFGYINNPGEMPTLYKSTTYTPGDPAMRQIQFKAKQVIRGIGFLPASKIGPDIETAKKAQRFLRTAYMVLALPLGFAITITLFFPVAMALPNDSNVRSVFGIVLIAIFTALTVFLSQSYFKKKIAKLDAQLDGWWESLTHDEKKLMHLLWEGSYCKRCATFSPAHV